MAAALTIAVLFAVSFAAVRISAVTMRLTGLPENVARFQCVSALTGTGFTTSESEMIVNYPVRRRILAILMIVGNLGLASVAATFIVSFVGTEPRAGAFVAQAALMAIAIGVTVLVMTNKTLDRAMCGLIGIVLMKTTTLGSRRYSRVLQVDTGFSIAEHIFSGAEPTVLKALEPTGHDLVVLAIRGKAQHRGEHISEDTEIAPGDTLICYGRDQAHDDFAASMPTATLSS